MFSSNQVLEISGSLSDSNELEAALEFALKYSGEDNNLSQEEIDRGCKLVYQITEDGRYCIGWGFEDVPKGWTEYPFKFDVAIVSIVIRKHLETFPIERKIFDGAYEKGFIMKCIDESLASENDGIKSPFYGIVYFKPYTCFYSK